MDSNQHDTHEQFASEWMIYREIIPMHREQFMGWIQPIALDFFKGKRFLDAGCGIGRNSLWPLRAGASSGVAFDFAPRTVEVARFNLLDHPRCEVLCQSIYDLDYENEFDVVICIGVIHHLANPRLALEGLVRSLKPGGTLIVWVYAREGNEGYLSWCDPFRKYLTSKLSPNATLTIAFLLTLALKAYLQLPHKDAYLRNLRRHSFRHMQAFVFDQLLPTIAHYWTKTEILNLTEGLGIRITSLTHSNGVSWTMIADKMSVTSGRTS